MSNHLQPLIHDQSIVLKAPTQAWSAADGSIGSSAIHGIYFSDVRLVHAASVTVGNRDGERIATIPGGAESVTIVSLQRHLDDRMPDPRVRSKHTRTASIDGVTESFRLESNLDTAIATTVVLSLRPDLADMDHVKAGFGPRVPVPEIVLTTDAAGLEGTADATATWHTETVTATLRINGGTLDTLDDGELRATWEITVPARGSATVDWTIRASDASAVVRGVTSPLPWSVPVVTAADERLSRWLSVALDDLAALRLSPVDHPDEVFLAAGAPWFFTLFGRDSIWAARMMLPLGTSLAADTLRILARLQGAASIPDTAEQPGKIMHELRRGALSMPGEGLHLPPLYYGTVDATPLWVCLLHDAWRWGMADDEVRALLPNLTAALEWMRDFGDADGDGLLEYVDETGHGLANQGWKDSGDSVQWRDGTLADGPIALCEVQAYAYEAAMHGADLLDHFGQDGSEWRDWAAVLRTRFHESFWIPSTDGAYPAIALDAQKRPVDTVTSNLGHLLGTGLLDADQSARIAAHLVSPQMVSGYGLRTMSTDSAGYWPLSYHGGSVWAHDTAIAISGLSRAGFRDESGLLASGLLAAAAGFDYRMPELHSGDPADDASRPIPYPAACRPQAWSAASAVSVLASVLGLDPDASMGVLNVSPAASGLCPMRVDGFRFTGNAVSIHLNADGEVAEATGATIEVG
ncbi:glycogen debranching N-terminal domain-containing protein [Marisediminicola senii]|uniref:glycogen debranching N-terminal domain-containing protein n=1 Tax=Marisediminicola senii TaxID=2711233 RepID=UPI0013EE2CAD|nr:glycogen debranching N-terminal domain-containing protein [Marisediminicola senii]